MWAQFRRLLLGTVIESMLETGVSVDFSTIRISFSDESQFRVPRLNNYMRFHGELNATLAAPLGDQQHSDLHGSLLRAWPEILSVIDLPIGDRLTNDRNRVTVNATETELHIAFDLEAD